MQTGDIIWAQIQEDLSWHAIRSEVNGKVLTLCGRVIPDDSLSKRDSLPSEKSCENCLRIIARAADGGK